MKTISRVMIIGATLALLAGLPVFAGGAQEETKPMGPVTITFWHVWGGPRIPVMEQQIADFQAVNPNITVEDTLIDQGGMDQKYLTAIAGGDPPDAIMVHGGRFFPAFAAKNVLVSVDEYLKKEGMKGTDIWYEAEFKTYQFKGKTYGLPLATGGGMFLFFYDQNDFSKAGLDPQKPPATWKELEAYAKKLTVRSGNKVSKMGFDLIGTGNFPFKEWLFLNNGNCISADGKKILYNSKEGLETLQWMTDFTDRLYGGYENIVGFTDSTTANGRVQRAEWYAGNIAMHIDGVWHFLQLQSSAPDKKYAVAQMPYNGDNSKAKVRNIVEGGWCYSIPVGAKHADAAWEWLKYTCAGEGNLNFFKAQLRPSPVKKFNDDPFFAENNAYWDVVQENLVMSEYSPAVPAQAEIDAVLIQFVDEALFQKKSPQAALTWGAESAQKILDEYWASQ